MPSLCFILNNALNLENNLIHQNIVITILLDDISISLPDFACHTLPQQIKLLQCWLCCSG